MRNTVLQMFSLRRLGAAILLTSLAFVVGARTSLRAQEHTIAVEVKVVNVLATVRDKHGQIINNLGKDDFILQEDGRPEIIKYFSRESDLPLTLGLLVDTSMSQRRVLGEERGASYSFLDKMLRAKDRAFVIHFDHEAELSRTSLPRKRSCRLRSTNSKHRSGPRCRGAADPEDLGNQAEDGRDLAGAAEVAGVGTVAVVQARSSTTRPFLRLMN